MSREMLLKLQGVQGSPAMLTIKVGFIFYEPQIIGCNCCLFESWTVVYSHLTSANLCFLVLVKLQSTVAQLTGWVEDSPRFLSLFLEAGYQVRDPYPLLPPKAVQSVTYCRGKGEQHLSMSPIHDRLWTDTGN